MKELTFELERGGDVPMYEQLYRAIAREITLGNLRSGERLPSRRSLSRHLGVSQQTALAALELLREEGYVRATARSGYFVEDVATLPEAAAPAPQARPEPERVPLFDFSPQGADVGLFPRKTWQRLVREALSEGRDWLGKGDAKGEFCLRDALCGFLYQYRGVRSHPKDLIIGSGVDQLLGVVASLLPPGSAVACEDPGYPEAGRAFMRAGHAAVPCRMDAQGILPSEIRRAGASLAYLTPAHQFPTGISMPAGRRAELLRWAQEGRERWLVEDDYDSEFRYSSRPLPAMQGMGGGGRTVYIGTFSRSLAPGLRVAYLVLPSELTGRYEDLGLRSGDAVSRFEQQAVSELLSRGYYSRHLRRAGGVYLRRCQALCALLSGIPGSRLSGQHAGLHLLLGIRGRNEPELVQAASDAGIPVKGLSSYSVKAKMPPALVLGFAGLPDDKLAPAVAALRTAWRI